MLDDLRQVPCSLTTESYTDVNHAKPLACPNSMSFKEIGLRPVRQTLFPPCFCRTSRGRHLKVFRNPNFGHRAITTVIRPWTH